MWQVEDLLRACWFDPVKIDFQLVGRFQAEEPVRNEISRWYQNLSSMMEKELILEKGHLQVITNLVNDLNEFHLKMLEVQNDQRYVQLFHQNQESIADFCLRSGLNDSNGIHVCLQALYGVMLLKLKNAEISELTLKTAEGFGQMIGHLSARYIQFENDDFEF